MKSNKYSHKVHLEDVGGGFTGSDAAAPPVSDADLDSEAGAEDPADALYPEPIVVAAHHKHSSKSVSNHLKAKYLSEHRLLRLSDELQRLATEIRYLNPVMAEALDDAWEATEEALEILENDRGW